MSCGFHNELASIDKQLEVGRQLAARRSFWGRLKQMLKTLGIIN